jgi:ribosome-associated translation inhibitor RaiA
MNIQVNIGHNKGDHEQIIQYIESVVNNTLGHLAEHISRIEVHLSDENNKKEGGYDKRCMMEARLQGHQPIAITNISDNIGQSINGAADKLKSSLDHTLGRLSDHEGRKHYHTKVARPE